MSSHPLQSNEILIDVPLLNYRTVRMSETSSSVKTVSVWRNTEVPRPDPAGTYKH